MPRPLPPVISEDEIGTSEYLRLREETLRRFTRRDDPYRRRQDPGPEPRDQVWQERRLWNGETRYVAGSGPSWVRHTYDPLDALKDD